MNREQATDVLKQIFEQCTWWIEGKSIKLMPPKANNVLSNTFQICIRTNGEDMVPNCIKTIAKENGLMVTEKDGYLIVYKPYPNVSDST